MNKILFFTFCFLLMSANSRMSASNHREQAALGVVERVTGQKGLPVNFVLDSGKGNLKGKSYFRYRMADDGTLTVTASGPVALCRGFYDFMKSNGGGICSWSGSNLRFPPQNVAAAEKETVSPFDHHYMFNVVTYGYTMPYWTWDRWEKEIDWMALHGFDMPLALVGYEAILARVLKKFGLTDDEINGYFVGPAHLPWMRMGNISGIDGPLNADWHRSQIALAHKILDRMRSLGMKPICPGFPGFVPEAMKRIYPDLDLIQTHWGGAFCNWMISPQEELFGRIGTEFIREWEKEFGKSDYYIVDSFNEMDIPFPEKGTKERYELLASYGDKVYQSIRRGNPRATWVMQGWMFGYQRDIWDYETLGALLSKVPDDRMLLLDLAVDYNRHFWHSQVNWEYYKGFYNKPWVYSVIPNMGGKTGMTGVLEFYANGHLDALSSPHKGRLVAHGMAPEGIENNEVIYELLSDAAWSGTEIDLRRWLRDYSTNRYGAYTLELDRYWDGMLKSVYGTFTDHPRYSWQFRPGSVSHGSVNISDDFFKGIEAFVEAGKSLKSSPLYLADLSELAAQYAAGKAELLLGMIDRQYETGDTARAMKLEKDFEYVMNSMDALLSVHPVLRLDRWTDFAIRNARTPEQRAQYERNARRIVTVWGPPVDDYSARVWSGLVRDYYLPRWQAYFASRKSGKPFDFPRWELDWVESRGLSPAKMPGDLLTYARTLLDYTAFITPASVLENGRKELGSWSVGKDENKEVKFVLPAGTLSSAVALHIERLKGNSPVSCSRVRLLADGKVVFESTDTKVLEGARKKLVYSLAFSGEIRGNNGVELSVTFEGTEGDAVSGRIFLMTSQD